MLEALHTFQQYFIPWQILFAAFSARNHNRISDRGIQLWNAPERVGHPDRLTFHGRKNNAQYKETNPQHTKQNIVGHHRMYDTLTEDKKQNNTGTSEYVLRNGGQTNIVMKYLKFFYFR